MRSTQQEKTRESKSSVNLLNFFKPAGAKNCQEIFKISRLEHILEQTRYHNSTYIFQTPNSFDYFCLFQDCPKFFHSIHNMIFKRILMHNISNSHTETEVVKLIRSKLLSGAQSDKK